MFVTKKIIDSSVIKDDNTGLYKITLPGITRYFESVLFSFKNSQKVFGNHFMGKQIDNLRDVIIGSSDIYGYKMICIIDLKTLKSEYYFLSDFNFYNFTIEGNIYFCLAYNDYKGNIGYYTNLDIDNYSLDIAGDKISIKNSIFGTSVFEFDIEKIISFEKKELKIFSNKKYTDYPNIVDFYIFEDLFFDNNGYSDFYDFLQQFIGKDIKVSESQYIKIDSEEYENNLFPKYKLNLSLKTSNNSSLNFSEIQKLVFGFFSENVLMYLIDDKKIESFFSGYLLDMSKDEIGELDIDFEFNDNIFETDEKFIKFKTDFLILKYNYFTLKESLDDIQSIDKLKENNPHVESVRKRGSITRQNLEKTIDSYEKILNVVIKKLEMHLVNKK